MQMTNQIEYRKGDLFSYVPGYRTILAHGVNCQGVMGSGVAKTFKQKYPEAFEDYLYFLKKYKYENDVAPLGVSRLFYSCSNDLLLASMFTQEFYGNDGRQYVNYEAFFDSFRKVADYYEDSTIIMPKIGAGLGGGDWRIIEGLMKIILETRPNVHVIVFEL
jgi:O-acetyl-ADP-ribose deacetylase (regulator of RNase III)